MVLIKLNMSGKTYFIVNLFILGFHVSLYIPVPFLSELKNTSFCVMSGQITVEVLRQNSSKKTFPLLRKTSFPKGQTVSFSIRIVSPQTTRVKATNVWTVNRQIIQQQHYSLHGAGLSTSSCFAIDFNPPVERNYRRTAKSSFLVEV